MSHGNLKVSPYVFIFKLDGKSSISANLATGEVVHLTDEEASLMLKGKTGENKQLVDSGFLVEDQEYVRNRVISRHREACFSPAVFNLTLLPTLNCNFACHYCFEKSATGKRMSEEIVERVVKLTKKNASRHLRTELSWYGGEPLLEMDLIANAHPRINEAVLSCGGEFTSSVTTNGYLLDKNVALLLRDLKIKFVHLTIDGNKEVHDLSRVSKDGAGTFEQIMYNLLNFLDIYPSSEVMIRVNARYSTSKTILDVLNKMPQHFRSRISIYLSRIISEQCNEGLSNELSALFKDIYKVARDKGFKVAVDNVFNPGPAVYCYAERLTSVVIDPEGFVFRCAYTDFSEKERIGMLNEEGEIKSIGTFGNYWDDLVLTEPDECLSCKYLPLCGFGCPRKRAYSPRNYQCKNQFCFLTDTLIALIEERREKLKL